MTRIRKVLLLIIMLTAFACTADAEENRVIRVGYIGVGGVYADDHGNYSGYIVEYLEELSHYTGWEYEFISVDRTDGMDMLESDEIDLFGMVRHTEEREARFLYSELSMVNDYTILCANADSPMYYQDYEAMDGARVGIVEDSIHESTFAAYAESLGISYELVHFASQAKAEAALKDGNIDLTATGGLSYDDSMKLIDQFQPSPTYFIMGRQNAALMKELDEAMQRLQIEEPDIQIELTEKYYGANRLTSTLFLTKEEQAYIDDAGVITIRAFTGRRPLGYEGGGRFIGVLVDYMDYLSQISGLQFRFEATDNTSVDDHFSAMNEENYALLHIVMSPEEYPTDVDIVATEPLFETSLTYIKRKDAGSENGRDDLTFALNREMAYLAELLQSRSDQYEILYAGSAAECMEAVIKGDADITIQDEHVAAYMMQKPAYGDQLMEVEGESVSNGLCLYAPADQEMLIRILNKTMSHLNSDQRMSAITNSMVAHSYEYEAEDILYEYRAWIITSSVLVVIILLLSMLLYTRMVKFRAQKERTAELQERVQRDELTGVYNRTYFLIHAEERIRKSSGQLYIVRVNISNFKIVNELHSEKKGDELLRGFARYLENLKTEKPYIVGRFNGDHFYLCMERSDFEKTELRRQFSDLLPEMDVSVTYGVYPVGEQPDIPVNIMCDRADMANAAKRLQGVEYIRYYSDEDRLQMLREQEIENEKDRALAERQFCIYIQPKYDIETEQVVGGEALVRWIHPQKGMIPPGEFIDLFERNGFIRELDYFVWEECCRFLAEAREKGLPTYPLSINVSRIHFYGSELVDKLLRLLETYGLSVNDLEIEITEGLCGENSDMIFSKCKELQRLGFKIAMDDFGSGYSSLNMLKEMPLDIIKMDLRFLSGDDQADQLKKGRSILKTLIELAYTLELNVVVEGVETEEQKEFIREIGSCYVQGYYFSRPVDVGSYEEKIRNWGGTV